MAEPSPVLAVTGDNVRAVTDTVRKQRLLFSDPLQVNHEGARLQIVTNTTRTHYSKRPIKRYKLRLMAHPMGYYYYLTGLLHDVVQNAEEIVRIGNATAIFHSLTCFC